MVSQFIQFCNLMVISIRCSGGQNRMQFYAWILQVGSKKCIKKLDSIPVVYITRLKILLAVENYCDEYDEGYFWTNRASCLRGLQFAHEDNSVNYILWIFSGGQLLSPSFFGLGTVFCDKNNWRLKKGAIYWLPTLLGGVLQMRAE